MADASKLAYNGLYCLLGNGEVLADLVVTPMHLRKVCRGTIPAGDDSGSVKSTVAPVTLSTQVYLLQEAGLVHRPWLQLVSWHLLELLQRRASVLSLQNSSLKVREVL